LKGRADLVANRQADWALGEAFAFGSLLQEQVYECLKYASVLVHQT